MIKIRKFVTIVEQVLSEMGQPADKTQVLTAGELLIDGGILPGQPDVRSHAYRIPDHVQPEHSGRARVRPNDRGQDAHGCGLARAVRAEQPEHAAGRDREVHPVQCDDVPEALGDADDFDCGRVWHVRHGSSFVESCQAFTRHNS